MEGPKLKGGPGEKRGTRGEREEVGSGAGEREGEGRGESPFLPSPLILGEASPCKLQQ